MYHTSKDIDDDLVEALKAGGIHLSRNGMKGEFLDTINYEEARFPFSQIIGKTLADLLPNEIESHQLTEMRIQVAKTGTPVVVKDIGTPMFSLPGFSHARLIIVPLYKDKSKMERIGSTTLLIDISDKCRELAQTNKQLEETVKRLETTNEELQKSMKAKSEFLALVSHEVRTPLNGIIGMLQLLEESSMDKIQREYVDTIYRSGQGLLRIINSILDFSKMDTGHIDFECNPFNIFSLVADAVAIIKAQQKLGDKLEFVAYVDPSIPQVLMGDDTRLFQILTNLLHNASKYTDKGMISTRVQPVKETEPPPSMTIYVKSEAKNSDQVTLKFDIEDTGVGIPSDFIAHMFEPFSQGHVHRARLCGGVGLGLAICKKLVEGMGGCIGADSAEGKGSKFWFKLTFSIPSAEVQQAFSSTKKYGLSLLVDSTEEKLPSKPFIEPPMSIERQNSPPQQPSQTIIINIPTAGSGSASVSLAPNAPRLDPVPSKPTPRVLVADDNIINLKVLCHMLERLGLEVDQVQDGQEAVDAFISHEISGKDKYSGLLLDVMMPGLRGDDATVKIREWEAKQPGMRVPIPIIAVTAHAIVGVDKECKDKGMSDYLPKPVMMQQLKEMLQKWHII